jgi:hypothetical protein
VKKLILHQSKIYRAFGLNIRSEITLHELSETSVSGIANIDVDIVVKDLTDDWNKYVLNGETYLVKENLILFRIEDTAIFCIKDGKEIFISPSQNCQLDKLKLFLLGTCFGALLIQRGILPLHGSAIEVNGKVYAIVGNSGAGKSTLASAFIKRGYKLLSDDVIPVVINNNNDPVVNPSYPQQKLWNTSLQDFGMVAASFNPIIERENKYAVPIHSNFTQEVRPLAGIFELTTTQESRILMQRFEGIERFKVLFDHTYRNFLIELLNLMNWHFVYSAKIIQSTKIYSLMRPEVGFTAFEMVDVILNNLHEEKLIC